ncbi:hypothetical protein F2P56_024297, partial [Juglans regia]
MGQGELGRVGEKFVAPFRMFGPELTYISFEHKIVPSTIVESSARTSLIQAMFNNDRNLVHISYHVENVEGEGLIVVMPSIYPATRSLEPTMLLCGKRQSLFVLMVLIVQHWSSEDVLICI